MNGLEDSENAKISDSAYSNSCSNSTGCRRSSKSTNSGSNFSGSSGYGFSSAHSSEKRGKEKNDKKKKPHTKTQGGEFSNDLTELGQSASKKIKEDDSPTNKETELTPSPITIEEEQPNFIQSQECIKVETNNEFTKCPTSAMTEMTQTTTHRAAPPDEGFSCVISMHDGVVMYATPSITTVLGFPKNMWLGRSFIDFVHPLDRDTFGSKIMSSVAISRESTASARSSATAVPIDGAILKTMCCRIRAHRGLMNGFGIMNYEVKYVAFALNFSFKSICDEEAKTVVLVIQATPFNSAFKDPNESVSRPLPFVIRHLVCGKIDYIDPNSVPYLGFLPQDISDRDIMTLYHPDDLEHVLHLYEALKRDKGLPRSKPYRLLTQNGHYVKVETEFSCFVNPWSRKLEYVRGKHFVVEGPAVPDVFCKPDSEKGLKITDDHKRIKENILKAMNEISTKSVAAAKQQMSKGCLELALVLETLVDDNVKMSDEQRLELREQDKIYYDRDSVMMLGEISPHYMDESKSSSGTPLSYNQLNYNENLQRYFDSYQVTAKQNAKNDDFAKPLQISDWQSVSSPPNLKSSEISTSPLMDERSHSLSELLLLQHNSEMEKDLIRKHREQRSEGVKEKKHIRQKKKDHLARCNAPYQLPASTATESQTHGVKRSSAQCDMEVSAHKHHCYYGFTKPDGINSWSAPTKEEGFNNMSVMSPVVSGLLPMYYIPTAPANMPMGSNPQLQTASVPYVMYPQAMFGAPFMYSPMVPQISPQTIQAWMEPGSSRQQTNNSNNNSCNNRVTFTEFKKSTSDIRNEKVEDIVTSDKADGESSYSSFCSSFFKTESGISNEGSYIKNIAGKASPKPKQSEQRAQGDKNATHGGYKDKKMPKRSDPLWMEQVCMTTDLMYKYQITTKNIDEVLEADRKKMNGLEQPNMVNEQLSQLYLDLKLEGRPIRLTLEEGITSSGSSGEDSMVMQAPKSCVPKQNWQKKRQYSRLMMIYEEDAPLPPPEDEPAYNEPMTVSSHVEQT